MFFFFIRNLIFNSKKDQIFYNKKISKKPSIFIKDIFRKKLSNLGKSLILTYNARFRGNQRFFDLKNRHLFLKYFIFKKSLKLPKVIFKNLMYIFSNKLSLINSYSVNKHKFLKTLNKHTTNLFFWNFKFFVIFFSIKKKNCRKIFKKSFFTSLDFSKNKNFRVKKYTKLPYKSFIINLFYSKNRRFSKLKFLSKKTKVFRYKNLIRFPKFKYSTFLPKLLLSFHFTNSYSSIIVKKKPKFLLNFIHLNFYFYKDISNLATFSKSSKEFYKTTDYNNVFLKTNHGSSFILNNTGLIFPLKFFYKNNKINLYTLKKKLYTFLKLNEYKMHIFNFKKKVMLHKIFFFRKNKSTPHYSTYLYNFFKKEQKDVSTTFYTTDLIYKKSFFFKESNRNINNFLGEIKIPRIRFKPGYQRLWRNYRIALSDSINYKYTYQKQLTSYLISFYRKLNQDYVSFNENIASKIIVYSKLLPDNSTFNIFIKNSLIFINGFILKNPNIYLYKNDFVQLEITNWYYIFFRWLRGFIKIRNNKFKKLVFRKNLPNKYKLMKQRKQRSSYIPNWINTIKHDFSDVKSFLEVDYMTLSVFVLYESNYLLYYTPLDIKTVPFNIYKMYNWKYIN